MITTGVLSMAWIVWNTAASAANRIMGRTVPTTANDIASDAATMTANGI